jgi:hypothetical protein
MTDTKGGAIDRTESARIHDDRELIESMEDGPSYVGSAGGNLKRDIATQDELKQTLGEAGVTRVRAGQKPEQANLPRFNEGNHKLNP